MLKFYKEFSANTSLHGIKYIAEKDRPVKERIWWGVMIGISFGLCSFLVGQVWRKWDENPIIVTFDENLTPVWKIPFPAVTVCPMATTNRSKFNYTRLYLHKMKIRGTDKTMRSSATPSQLDLDTFDYTSLFCKDVELFRNFLAGTVKEPQNMEYFKNISLQTDEVMSACQMLGEDVDCDKLFTRVLTDIGLCFTTNMLNAEDIYSDVVKYDKSFLNSNQKADGWNIDNGYPQDSLYHTYPQRAKGSGKTSGLKVFLKNNKINTDFRCNGVYKGFAVLIHPPYALPKNAKNFIFTPYETDFSMVVTPEMIYTSGRLDNYKPEKRQCYFSGEKKLKFFKTYSRENCETECITNFTMSYCGCVSPGMPRDESMPKCAGGAKTCLKEAMTKVSIMDNLYEIPSGIWDEGSAEKNREAALRVASQCNCLQSCNSIGYHVAVHHVQLDWSNFFKYRAKNINFNYTQQDIDDKHDPSLIADNSLLNVYIEKPHFIMYKRSELYDITDFLANCGGLFGVCLGFSILSLVEIIYYFCIRFVCSLRKNNVDMLPSDRLLPSKESQKLNELRILQAIHQLQEKSGLDSPLK